MSESGRVRVAIGQIAPVFLNREATIAKVVTAMRDAAAQGARLIAFGETLIPAYPAWLSRTDAARFEARDQKELHARYLEQAVDIDAGHLDDLTVCAKELGLACIVGVAERPRDRAAHSVFCSAVTISPAGSIASVHRKLVPTYEERLAWAYGDGHGLRAHNFLPPFTVGALNCWENWMPLARAALYAQGVDLHIALWPGNDVNTRDITRFIARESRSFVLSASTILRPGDLPDDLPAREAMLASSETRAGGVIHNGGSAIAGPDGNWIVEPVLDEERIIIADLDHAGVLEERQNFDPAGHYARPDVLQLSVNRARQRAAQFDD